MIWGVRALSGCQKSAAACFQCCHICALILPVVPDTSVLTSVNKHGCCYRRRESCHDDCLRPFLSSNSFLFHSHFTFPFPCWAYILHLCSEMDNNDMTFTSIGSVSKVHTTKKDGPDSYLSTCMVSTTPLMAYGLPMHSQTISLLAYILDAALASVFQYVRHWNLLV